MKDLIFGVIFIALGIGVWLLAREFPAVPGMPYGADLFPTLIAIGMAGGGSVLSFNAARQLRAAGRAARFASDYSPSSYSPSSYSPPSYSPSSFGTVVPCALVVAYIYLSESLGAAVMMLIIMQILLLQRGVRPMPALAISVVASSVISFSFGHLLKVPLPVGLLGF